MTATRNAHSKTNLTPYERWERKQMYKNIAYTAGFALVGLFLLVCAFYLLDKMIFAGRLTH